MNFNRNKRQITNYIESAEMQKGPLKQYTENEYLNYYIQG